MRVWTSTWAGAVVVVLLLAGGLGGQEVDLAKVLVGKWEGDVQLRGRGDSNRTLLIESVTRGDAGKWTGTGRFGVTGRGLGRINIAGEESGGNVSLQFETGAGSPAQLSLQKGRWLTGTIRFRGTGEGLRDLPIRLEKAD